MRKRGEFMQEAVPVGTGAMAAIMGLELPAVEKVCADAAQGEVVEIANVNSAQQIVAALSQVKVAVDQVSAAAQEAEKAAEQAAAAARQQAQGAEELSAAIEEIASLADELQSN